MEGDRGARVGECARVRARANAGDEGWERARECGLQARVGVVVGNRTMLSTTVVTWSTAMEPKAKPGRTHDLF